MKRLLRLLSVIASLLLVSSWADAQEWKELIVNGDFEGSNLTHFNLNIVDEGARNLTTDDIVVDDNDVNNHCAKISFTSSPTNTQFIIKLAEPLSEGDLYEFSFRAKSTSVKTKFTTDVFGVFDVINKNIWEPCASNGTVNAAQDGCQTITINFSSRTKQSDIIYFDDISLKVRNSSIPIEFADAKVKEICVNRWDANNDDELSLGEAAAVKELGYMTFANQDITSFDELQYFTGLTEIKGDFYGCTNLTSIIIPDNVTKISKDDWRGAFAWCRNLISVTFGKNLTMIGENSFTGCSALNSINLNNVRGIDAYAFSLCESLHTLTFSRYVQHIDDFAYSGCSGLNSIVVEEGNPTYDSRDNCNAIIETATNRLIRGSNNTTIPNSVTAIGSSAFSGISSPTSITISKSVVSIGEYAFQNCAGPNLISINVEDGNPVYDSHNNCNAIIETATGSLILGCKNTTIPDETKVIGPYAFSNCSDVAIIKIPDNVKKIGASAFKDCSSLNSVVIGNCIKTIENMVFMNCANLQDLYCYAEQVPNASTDAFLNTNLENVTLHVPAASIEAYKVESQWKDFGNIIALTDEDPKPTGITNIHNDSMSGKRYYSIDGKELSKPQCGLNIIRMKDGTTRKAVKK